MRDTQGLLNAAEEESHHLLLVAPNSAGGSSSEVLAVAGECEKQAPGPPQEPWEVRQRGPFSPLPAPAPTPALLLCSPLPWALALTLAQRILEMLSGAGQLGQRAIGLATVLPGNSEPPASQSGGLTGYPIPTALGIPHSVPLSVVGLVQ